jgi:hypothetical protein
MLNPNDAICRMARHTRFCGYHQPNLKTTGEARRAEWNDSFGVRRQSPDLSGRRRRFGFRGLGKSIQSGVPLHLPPRSKSIARFASSLEIMVT